MYDFLFELFICFCETFLFYLFIDTKLSVDNRGSDIRIRQTLFLSVQWIFISYLHFAMKSSNVTFILSWILYVIFAMYFYTSPIPFRVFWSGMYSVICLLARYITVFSIQFFSAMKIDDFLLGNHTYVPMSLLYIAINVILIFALIHIGNQELELPLTQRLFYLLISIAGVSIANYILMVTQKISTYYHSNSLIDNMILINLFFLLLFLSLLLYIYQLGQSKAQNIRLLEQSKQLSLEKQQYDTLLQTTESLREMKHDFKFHLETIQSLSENKDYDKLDDYVQTYLHHLEKVHHLLATGNTAIDCILSNKIAYARQNNIHMDYSVFVPSSLPIDDITLSSLLGNLMDNAIEACQRNASESSAEQNWISFQMKPYQNMLLIHVENSYNGTYKMRDKETFLSLKGECGHGLGIKRIQSIIKEANGIIQITPADKVFTIHIMIPLKED